MVKIKNMSLCYNNASMATLFYEFNKVQNVLFFTEKDNKKNCIACKIFVEKCRLSVPDNTYRIHIQYLTIHIQYLTDIWQGEFPL